jgi:hypothetical protein
MFGVWKGVINMKVADGVDVPNGLHSVVASMDFGVNGDFSGLFCFGPMSNLPSSGPSYLL